MKYIIIIIMLCLFGCNNVVYKTNYYNKVAIKICEKEFNNYGKIIDVNIEDYPQFIKNVYKVRCYFRTGLREINVSIDEFKNFKE